MAIADTINNLLFSCTTNLFKAYGVQLAEDSAGPGETSSERAAIVGFQGAAISGALLLIADSGLIRASMPTPDTKEREWLGELANQLLGRVKNRLLNYRVDVAAMTPLLLSSVRIVPVGSREHRQGITMTTAERERVTVWIDYHVHDAEQLANLARGDEQVGREGELILF